MKWALGLEICQWWAQRIQTASRLKPMMISLFQIPDRWKHAWIPLKAASNATFHMSTLKPWTKKYRISWKQFLHAHKKFKSESSRQEFFKVIPATSLHVTKWSIQTTVISKETRSPSSKSIWDLRKSWRNTLMKLLKSLFLKSQVNFFASQITSGCNTPKWWTKDSNNLNWSAGQKIWQSQNSTNTENYSKR